MTQDEIIEMARQAGFYVDEKFAINDGIETAADFSQELNVFAKLVAAKERESIIQIIKAMPFSNWFQFDVIEAIRARGDKHD